MARRTEGEAVDTLAHKPAVVVAHKPAVAVAELVDSHRAPRMEAG